MLFQPTNIIPDTRTGIGFGVIDASDKMQVSWQVNGDFPRMTAFRITIYDNNAASTIKYDSAKLTAGCPFDGRDANGEIKFFSYTIAGSTLASAGITNGHEYKMTIAQYYMDGNTETNIGQSSASVFITRQAPTFTMSSTTVGAAEHTFTWNFSQAQDDTIEWIRYQIQIINEGDTATIYDSGNIYGSAEYQCTYSGFISGNTYQIRATGQTSSGVPIATEWSQFTVSYTGGTPTGNVIAECYAGHDAVAVMWDTVSTASGQNAWVLYRKDADNIAMLKVGEFPVAQTSVYDFGASSGQGPYSYYLFQATQSSGGITYNSSAAISNEVTPTRYYWSLLECEENQDGVYRVLQEFYFKNNLDSGSLSNNNNPNVMQNFTAMPTVQLSPSNYKSGSLSALLGQTSLGQYVQDTLTLRESLMALSTTQNTLFLKSSKGDVIMVVINGPINASISDKIKGQPQVVSVPWVEIDDTPASIIAYPGDSIFNT